MFGSRAGNVASVGRVQTPTLAIVYSRELEIRNFVPRGTDAMDLHWTYLGFADDTPELRKRRLKQANLVGPAGFVSMEDGCIGGFVQRGAMAAADELSVVEMGGAEARTTDTRATETAVRGFWQVYRRLMGL